MKNYMTVREQATSNNKKAFWFGLVALEAVMLYEIASYSAFGLSLSDGYLLYPYVLNIPFWLMKNVLIVIGLIIWMTALTKINNIFDERRYIRMVLRSILFILGAIIFSVAVEWGKSGGGFFYGPADESYTAPFQFVILYLPAALVLLLAFRFIGQKVSGLFLKILSVLGGMVAIALIAHALFTQWALAAIPLDAEILRSKETMSLWKTPEQYGLDFAPKFIKKPGSRSAYEKTMKQFHLASENLTADQWETICRHVKLNSLGTGILGNKAANSCFYIGAIIYEEPLMCEKATGMEGICRSDLAQLLNDITVCSNEIDCWSRNPALLGQKGMSCESLKTIEDDQVPFYNIELTPYAECQLRTMRAQGSRIKDANGYRLATTKLIVNEWYADADDPQQSYVELKNVSDNTIILKDVEINRMQLPQRTLAPGEIIVLYESDLQKYAANLSKADPRITKFGPLLSRRGDILLWGGAIFYDIVPFDQATGVVNLQALREGRYHSDWQEVYQIMPKTPGRENNVQVTD